jgi:hypothetical protein
MQHPSGSAICTQSNDCGWDATPRNIGGVTTPAAHYVGKRSSTYPHWHIAYREANHSWHVINSNLTLFGDFGHGADGNALNPATGRVYFRPYNSKEIFSASPTSYPWSLLTTWPDSAPIQVFEGVTFWSGSFTGSSGSGLVLVWNSGATRIQMFDTGTLAWRSPITVSGASSTLHSVAVYSPVHNCAIVGGGDANPRNFWKLSSSGAVVQMPNSSADVSVGPARGGKLVCDPASGNFILVGETGVIQVLDPNANGGSGQWTTLGGSHAPPSAIYDTSSRATICWGVQADASHAYGVTVWASVNNAGSDPVMYAYRHK